MTSSPSPRKSSSSPDRAINALLAKVRAAMANDRLAHAYLLCGDSRENLEAAAFELCAAAACASPNIADKPCGVCAHCVGVRSRKLPDLHVIEPASASRQIVIGKPEEPDTLRWFQAKFHLTSSDPSGRKLGVILDAECLNTAAQNAFLKTLEEPPRGSFFVLATAHPNELLPTVRSRCHKLFLLSNRGQIGFKEAPALWQTLLSLIRAGSDDFTAATKAAAALDAISKGLDDEAKEATTAKWADRLAAAASLEPKAKERVEDKFEAAAKAEYILLRSAFVNAIVDWFSLLYQVDCGLRPSETSLPESVRTAIMEDLPTSHRVSKGLAAAERLARHIEFFNVDERLAFMDFCFGVAYA